MGEKSTEIEREIVQTRAELGSNLRELEHRVKEETDWRCHYRRNPFRMIALAFGAGLVISKLVP